MDAYQQHHGYMRPPQPPPPPQSAAEPYHYHQQQQPRPPLPPQGNWFPHQFHYHPPPSSSSHSPSPPPPQQWATAPPHSDHLAPPPPPPHAYATHLPDPYHQFPPPHPHAPPLPPPHSQEWRDPNWGQQQSWNYTAHNNGEDWAARARAWAASKQVAMDNQQSQSQFIPGSRPEEQSQFHDQFSQGADSHYIDTQQQPFSASGYQQFPAPVGSVHPTPSAYPPETAPFNSERSSYVPDGHMSYNVVGGTSAGGPTTSPSVHQQEVPSSYSSVTGKEETADRKEDMYNSLSFPMPSAQGGQYTGQPALPAIGRSVSSEQTVAYSEQTVAYSDQTADMTADLGGQPLDFGPSFNRDHDGHVQPSYSAHDSTGTIKGIGPVDSWTPAVATGAVYPPIPPVLPSVPQPDPSMGIPSVSGHVAPPFGSFPGSSFQPTIPSVGAPYVLSTGAALHPTTFQGDAYGISSASERPKKASVPNWLKEEIIKNASVITRSSLEHPKEETESIEDGGVEKSFGKGDQVDGKSLDSSRSTEEEEDDEDFTEAARTAAINQEIKRVLTEVLLKVTDELFDEIATKVLDEDDLTAEENLDTFPSNNKASPSPPAVLIPKASAMIKVPIKANEPHIEDFNEKSSSSAPGNVLGLANYGSDEDDDEVQSSSRTTSVKNAMVKQSTFPKDMCNEAENGSLRGEPEEQSGGNKNLGGDLSKPSPVGSKHKINFPMNELGEEAYPSKAPSGIDNAETDIADGTTINKGNVVGSKVALRDNVMTKSEQPREHVSLKKSIADDYQARESRTNRNNVNQQENRSHLGKDSVKEAEHRVRPDESDDDIHRRQDEKHPRKEKENWNGSKERSKERGDKYGEKANELESRKRSSHLNVKEAKREADKPHRTSTKEDARGKREWSKDKEEERARHKITSDSSRDKRRRSSSFGSGARDSRDKDSSDELSDDSRRKLHSRRRELSPSPVRSRRRYLYVSIDQSYLCFF
uniref:Uncharacterized protein n=1 Tax=Rhizophora mucronata TaxID=61149 RepID=A0A2P2L9J0_RHIMU